MSFIFANKRSLASLLADCEQTVGAHWWIVKRQWVLIGGLVTDSGCSLVDSEQTVGADWLLRNRQWVLIGGSGTDSGC